MRHAMVERAERLERAVVVVAALQREAALARRRHHLGRRQRAGVLGLDPEAREPGRGEHGRVDLAVGELAQARVDVPAERRDGQAGERGEQLRPAAEARGADHRVAASGAPRG